MEANAIEAVDRQINHLVLNGQAYQNAVVASTIATITVVPRKRTNVTDVDNVGHFQSQCRTRAIKRKSSGTAKQFSNKKKFNRKNNHQGSDDVKVGYVFHIDDDTSLNWRISDRAWEYLKNNSVSPVSVRNQVRNPNKKFIAHGSRTPSTVIGSFSADINAENKTKQATFFVIKDGERNLLGKGTAVYLGVLKMGLG
nr:unnamed protein product [Callosobruchus chinensis]